MKNGTILKSMGALTLALALTANLALASNPNPTVLPINSNSHGRSYAQWADAWWQWFMAIPADKNPILDSTGEFVSVGQSGQVWFLAGTYSGVAVRTATIPAGKALFFPIYNYCWILTPTLGDPEWSPETEAMMRATAAAQVDGFGPSDLTCEVDGRAVADILSYRCPTEPDDPFMVFLPDNDVWGVVGSTTIDGGVFQSGTYGPSVQDGIYLMLTPLSKGEHTIRFTAGDFLDVTYHLTVLK